MPVTVVPRKGSEVDEVILRNAIIAEMCEKLQVITRDLQYHEIPVEVEFLTPFDPELHQPGPPPLPMTDDR